MLLLRALDMYSYIRHMNIAELCTQHFIMIPIYSTYSRTVGNVAVQCSAVHTIKISIQRTQYSMTSGIDLAYLGSMVLVATTGYVVQYSSGAEFSLPFFLSLFFFFSNIPTSVTLNITYVQPC